MTNHPPSVLWHCWLGHQTCKNRRPYNLYCVGAEVKPCSINQSINVCIRPECSHILIYPQLSESACAQTHNRINLKRSNYPSPLSRLITR